MNTKHDMLFIEILLFSIIVLMKVKKSIMIIFDLISTAGFRMYTGTDIWYNIDVKIVLINHLTGRL